MRLRLLILTMGASVVLITSGCHKKTAMAPPPPPPPSPTREAPAPPPERPRQPVAEAPTAPPAPAPAPVATEHTQQTLADYLNRLLDAYFDYDKSELRNDAQTALNKNSSELLSLLKEFPNTRFVLEGDCDERGSAEYNLALGDRRAMAAKEFLTQIGVPVVHLTTITYGKERPVCTEHSEDCWQKNRRAHLSVAQ
jgi:peptidoglycan-associated lipoprotein